MEIRSRPCTREWISGATTDPIVSAAQWVRRVVKPAAFVACLIPAALIVIGIFNGDVGPNPIEEITHRTGKTALTLLLVTLSVTPVRAVTRIGALISLRRMLGLFAFGYVCLHFLIYVLDQFSYLPGVLEDIARRPYVTVGFASFLMLIPLAVTSTKGWVKRIGGKRWNRLHRLVYVAAAGGVLHFLWLVKIDRRTPIVYGMLLVGLLSARLVLNRRSRRPVPRGRSEVATPVLEPR